MDLACFGIEFETCVCDTSNKSGSFDLEKYRDKLQAINDAQGIGASFESSDDPTAVNYGVWMATIDRSIRCGVPDSTFSTANRPVEKTKDCVFKSVELVSPKTAYTRDEYSKFTRVINEVILNETFEYDINKSQGMHTNISHPDQDKLKMLKAWWYFEPVILTFVPPERRRSKYAIPVRERFQTIDDLVANWEEFYVDPDSEPAKYTALCVKSNRFEVRIIPAKMSSTHITAWLTLCIRFLFASIIKSVDFDFMSMPAIDDLFKFIDVDFSSTVSNLRKYFYSLDSVRRTYPIFELIKSGQEDNFVKITASSPEMALELLKGCVPIIPSLKLLKFFRALFTAHESLRVIGEDAIREYILKAFNENKTSINRSYEPAFYKEYIYFADYDLAYEILKTAIEYRDCETVNVVAHKESCEIGWDDILLFNNEWLVGCYENELPPYDMNMIKSWNIFRIIQDRYPDVEFDVFPASWIEPDIIEEQFALISDSTQASDYAGFEQYTTEATDSIRPKLLPIILHIINVYQNDPAISDVDLWQYINNLYMGKNALLNCFLASYVLSENVDLCLRLVDVHVKFLNNENMAGMASSELLNNCLRVIPRELIFGKYEVVDEILTI